MTGSKYPTDDSDRGETDITPNTGSKLNSRISDDALLSELKRLAGEVGCAPSMREMREMGEYSAKVYQSHFGAWSNAVTKIGLTPRSSGRSIQVSKQDIRDAIQELAEELGRPPTSEEMEAQGRHSQKTAYERFGSWNNALRESGFEPHLEQSISKSRLLEEIQRLANEIGYPPSTNDLKRDGKFSHRAYFRQFEDWHSAVRAAGYEPRGWPSGPDNPQWVGGYSKYYYGANWKTRRVQALERDGFSCQMPRCDITNEDHLETFDKELEVHHIMPVKTFYEGDEADYDAMNKLENLITLCSSHHRYWERMSPLQPDLR
jgi:hypothetical protein